MKKKYLNLEFCHDLSAPNMKNSNAPHTNLTEIVWLFVKTKAQSWSGFMVEWKFCVLFSHFLLSELLKGEHGHIGPSNRTFFEITRFFKMCFPFLKDGSFFMVSTWGNGIPLRALRMNSIDVLDLRGPPSHGSGGKTPWFLHGRCFMFIKVVFGMFHVCNLGYL